LSLRQQYKTALVVSYRSERLRKHIKVLRHGNFGVYHKAITRLDSEW